MSVLIGSARIDENGNAHGGAAGDQTGKEVSTQNWYKHSKGWVLIRPKSAAVAEKIAADMEAACRNSKIGYDQYQRDTLYSNVKPAGFDCSKTTKAVETDCSALVRVCVAFALGKEIDNFRTTNQVSVLMATGAFDKFTESKYTNESNYLKRGDILVTKTQGHTVVVLTNGNKAGQGTTEQPELVKGDSGSAVSKMQNLLIAAGYDLPKYGADGDFGDETLKAVKAFQTASGLEVDGIVGVNTWAALTGAQGLKTVLVTGGAVNIRAGASLNDKILGVVHAGDKLDYVSTASNGWFKIKRNGVESYISNKYSKIK